MRNLSLAVSVLLCCCVAWAQGLSPAQINSKCASSTVLVKTDAGAGTGFILSSDGIIVTALHVVADAKTVGVKTASGDIFDKVLLLARDERKDIALLKIAGFDLPTAEMENSNDISVGEHVTVIGNPLGTEQLRASVTDGIVSGIRDFGWGYKVIQLSAPISPGNSGGPVFSERGKVIGIAAFKLVGGENLNFAVPINYVRGLLEIADKTHPVQTWGGSLSQSAFAASKASAISGTWKSTCGGIFQIVDKGSNVRVLNIRTLDFTYDLKWEGDVVFGIASGYGTYWFLLKRPDGDHLLLWRFRAKRDDNREERLARARAESDKKRPECTWVKVAD